MVAIDKLAWLYVKDKRLLGARSKGKELFYIPGGKREKFETDHEALIREIKEELAIDISPETIVYAGAFEAQAHEKMDGQLVKITCYTAKFVGKIKANAEIEEVIWLNYKDKTKCSLVTQLIIEWLASEGMID